MSSVSSVRCDVEGELLPANRKPTASLFDAITMFKLLRRLTASTIGSILSKYSRASKLEFVSPRDIRGLRISFSQLGEDLVIEDLLRACKVEHGSYLDIGAFDPVFFSNTRLLNMKGWSGINVEMDAVKIDEFQRWRPNDDNVNAAVSREKKTLLKLVYHNAATNRLVVEGTAEKLNALGEPPIQESTIIAEPVVDIIRRSRYSETQIEFVNIDCEGHDFEVLKSVFEASVRPHVLCIEALDQPNYDEIDSYMSSTGYAIHARIGITCIYRKLGSKSEL